MSPTRLSPGAVAATPRGSRPGRPGRSGAGTIHPGPSPRGRRATGPAAATIPRTTPSEASTPPRAGPARTRRQPQARSDPSKNPTTMTAAGSSPRRAVEDPGRLRRAQQPDPDTSTHRRTDRTGRSPPPRRMRRRSTPTRTPGRRRPPLPPEPVPHAGLPEPRPQPPDPGALLRGHGISAETGALPPPSRDPAPDRPHHRTVRSGHPGHRPGPPDDPENDPPPQTPHRIPAPTRPNPTSPTTRKTPNTPKPFITSNKFPYRLTQKPC